MPLPPLLLGTSTSRHGGARRFLRHAEALYAVAHALTLDAAQATKLVERVMARADAEILSDEDEKAALMRLLHEEYRVNESVESKEVDSAFSRTVAVRAVRRVLPAAFASLGADARELLVLAHVERFDLVQVASITGMPPEEAHQQVRVAEAALESRIRHSLTRDEAALLDLQGGDWLRAVLGEMISTEFPALPPTALTELHAGSGPASEPAQRARQPERRRTRKASERLKKTGVALLIIFFAGFFAYGASRILERPPETNALVLSADAATSSGLDLATNSAQEIDRFVAQRLDWRLTVPEVAGASLVGVRLREIGDGIVVPAIVYDDAQTNSEFAVVAYTYALLDRAGDRLQFEPATLSQIQTEGHYELHDLGQQRLLIWRHRNQIFVAVTEGAAEDLQDRIQPAS